MLEELARLRKLVRAVEKGTQSFAEIYKRIDKIEEMVAQSDSEEEETPKKYIKPIQGLLDNYQKSMDRLREENKKLCLAAQSNCENKMQNDQYQTYTSKDSRKECRPPNRPASNPSKSIKELDAQILFLTNEIRNTLR